MKTKDLQFVKEYLQNDFLLNDYIYATTYKKDKIKIFFSDSIITICEMGFAYLVSWWCDGTITASKADNLNKLCKAYNERF